MAVKYVKDFQFDKSFGYTGSAGTGPVSNNERAKSEGPVSNKERTIDDSAPTPAEIVKMRQAREYMKEDKATSDAAKREMGFKKGGKVVEKATGEAYPSRKAMVKHEKTETPRMQKEEVVQKQVVRGPAMAAGRDPRIPMFKCGGKAKK